MIAPNMKEFLQFFVETARERIKNLSDSLLVLEKDQKNADEIEKIFQNAHSLKGEAAMMPFTSLAYLMHVIEDAFFEIKEGRLSLTKEVVDKLLGAFDNVEESIKTLEKTEEEIDMTDEIDILKTMTGVTTQGGGKSHRSVVSDQAKPNIQEDQKKKLIPATVNTLNVPLITLDAVLSNVEELLVSKLRLDLLLEQKRFTEIAEISKSWGRVLSELRFMVMKSRLIPLNFIFDRFPRMVRDISSKEGKEVDFAVSGGDTPLDRTVIDHINEPLVHLIRNAIDHGIEPSLDRINNGKSKNGHLSISATRDRGFVLIKVRDDGAGLDRDKILVKAIEQGITTSDKAKSMDPDEINLLIFEGISTSEEVTTISGRGVGMKAVRNAVAAAGGTIRVNSVASEFTEFTLRLPITLAVIRALLVRIGGAVYAIPASAIDISTKVRDDEIKHIAGIESFIFKGYEVPLVSLSELYSHSSMSAEILKQKDKLVVITSIGAEQIGLVVDSLLKEEEIIVKTLPPVFRDNSLFSGVTILGSGGPCLILDVLGTFDSARKKIRERGNSR